MRNIWQNKTRHMNVTVPLSFILLALIILWLVSGVGNASKMSDDEQLEAVRNSVARASALCYSIDGEYPLSLDYLKENYGLSYDESRYLVHYDAFASNLSPDIQVAMIEKEQNYE